MKKVVLGLAALIGPLRFAQSELPFDANVNFLTGLPESIQMGEPSGVAVNSKGHVFVFSRGNSTGPAYGATASQLLEFDAPANSSAKSAITFMRGPSRTQ